MNLPNKTRFIFKSIASLSACVFLWQQVSWAGGAEIINKVNNGSTQSGYVTPDNLQSGQAVAESVIGMKNMIENFSATVTGKTNEASGVVPTYYKNGRLESETLTAPDANGNIYYHYINENWDNQGHGRVDKSRRQTSLNGELSHAYTYYKGTSRVQTKNAYSDAKWTNLVATYAYYNNANNRIETKTLLSPDTLGNIYYHYMDEAGFSEDCGRYDKARRKTALNGELSYSYTYHSDNPFRIQTKVAYSDANWKKAVVTYTYYNDTTNRLQSKIVAKSGLTTIYYNDETGRIQQIDAYSDATRTDLISSTTYCNDETHRIQSQYDSATRILTTYYNDAAGRAQSIFDAGTGVTTTYYNDIAGRVESKILPAPDAQGIIYYHYLNETVARVDGAKRETAFNGELSYTYVYFGDTQQFQYKYAYQNPDFAGILATYEYNVDGLLIKKTLSSGEEYEYDAHGRIIKYTKQNGDYINTAYWQSGNKKEEQFFNSVDIWQKTYKYYDSSMGNLAAETLSSPDSNGAIAYTYTYFPSSQQVQFKYCYKDQAATNLVVTYEYSSSGELIDTIFADSSLYTYYPNGRMASKTLISADSYGVIYYHYIDENWNNQGYGRIDQSRSQVPLNGNLIYTQTGELVYLGEFSYSYNYYEDTGFLQTKNAYSDSNWTMLVCTYMHYNDSTNRLMSKIDVTNGITYTYYNDPSGYIESKALSSSDSFGNIYYHYINEDWNERSCGKIDKSTMQYPVNGELSYSYSYYNDATGRIQAKNAYSDSYQTILVGTYGYYNDSTGRIESKTEIINGMTYEYYNDSLVESITFSMPDSYGNIYYHYIDEDWNGRGYGRIDKSINMDGPSYLYSYYNDAPDRMQAINVYSDNGLTMLASVSTFFDDNRNGIWSYQDVGNGILYTFYNESGYKVESKTLSTPDAFGAIYYHYDNNNSQYGSMIDKIIEAYPKTTPTWSVHIEDSYTLTPLFCNELSYTVGWDSAGSYIWNAFSGSNWSTLVWSYISYKPPDPNSSANRSILTTAYGTFVNDLTVTPWITEFFFVSGSFPRGYEVFNNLSDQQTGVAIRSYINILNASNENFLSGIDPQQQQVSNLNKYPISANEPQIDLSAFRSFDDFIAAVQEKYSADPKLEELLGSVENLRNYLKEKYPLINIDGDISLGVTLTSPPTPDGARIEISSFSGESFVGDFNTPPWLGVFNGSDGYAQADISVKNGTTIEASMTTKIGPMFNRTIISSDLFESRADFGSYTHGSGYTLDFTSSTFTGSRSDGTYFGASYDTLNSITQLKTSTETLVFVPKEVLEGERMPVTVTESYGKLLYDIYNNGKGSLTPVEVDLIQTKTLEIVQDTLQNVAGITQNDINAIAASQSTNIINIGRGLISYNPPN